jgi:hypothetical protein
MIVSILPFGALLVTGSLLIRELLLLNRASDTTLGKVGSVSEHGPRVFHGRPRKDTSARSKERLRGLPCAS